MERILRIICVLVLACFGAMPASAGPFGEWIGIVVAGDNTADGGGATEVFDNARRDIARHLVSIGFEPTNVRQFSVQPGRYPEAPLRADYQTLRDTIIGLTQTVRGSSWARQGSRFRVLPCGTPFTRYYVRQE